MERLHTGRTKTARKPAWMLVPHFMSLYQVKPPPKPPRRAPPVVCFFVVRKPLNEGRSVLAREPRASMAGWGGGFHSGERPAVGTRQRSSSNEPADDNGRLFWFCRTKVDGGRGASIRAECITQAKKNPQSGGGD